MSTLAPMKFMDKLRHKIRSKYNYNDDQDVVIQYEINKNIPPDHMQLTVFTMDYWQAFMVDEHDFDDIDILMDYCMDKLDILYNNVKFKLWLLDNCFENRQILPPSEIGEMINDKINDDDNIVSKFVSCSGDEYGYAWNIRMPIIDASYSSSLLCESWLEIGEAVHKYFEGSKDQIEKYFIEKENRERNAN